MGRGIVEVIRKSKDMEVVAVADIDANALERTKPFLPKEALVTTNPMEVLTKKLDVLVEATPTVLEAALLIRRALKQKTHVVLMNGEVDQTFGRLLTKEAEDNGVILTSDAGDQHGVLVRMINDIRSMGFEIVIAGNDKGFLDHYANPESIKEEAAKRRLSLTQCTSYTDGTKLAIEMALVANALDLDILQTGMTGPRVDHVNEALKVFDLERARELGGVADYVLGAQPGGSVFVIGYSNDPEDLFYMNYYKMGKGPYYLFMRPYHLCHYETPLAIRNIMKFRQGILVQKKRVLEVGCRAKINLHAGTKLEGIGGHHLYGVLEKPKNLPIGMAEGTILIKSKKKDEAISWDDVKFPKDDPRLALWQEQTMLEMHTRNGGSIEIAKSRGPRAMRLLITGASGLLGLAISKIAVQKGYEVYSAYHTHEKTYGKPVRLDIRDYKSVEKIFKEIKPDFAIHAAAITDVDRCEQEKELAWDVNVQGTKNIVEQAKNLETFLVYVSTDYVFSGKKGLYAESDEPNPVNYYGQTKLKGEQEVKNSQSEWCIVRPSVIYGAFPVAERHNFALWAINEIRKRKDIEIITDQWVSPTLNTNLANMILEIIERHLTGIYHLAGASRTSRFQFAHMLAETFNLDRNAIKPTTLEKMNWLANRPKDSSLKVSKATRTLTHKPMKIERALKKLKAELTR